MSEMWVIGVSIKQALEKAHLIRNQCKAYALLKSHLEDDYRLEFGVYVELSKRCDIQMSGWMGNG
jgi:hypothetical protein